MVADLVLRLVLNKGWKCGVIKDLEFCVLPRTGDYVSLNDKDGKFIGDDHPVLMTCITPGAGGGVVIVIEEQCDNEADQQEAMEWWSRVVGFEFEMPWNTARKLT